MSWQKKKRLNSENIKMSIMIIYVKKHVLSRFSNNLSLVSTGLSLLEQSTSGKSFYREKDSITLFSTPFKPFRLGQEFALQSKIKNQGVSFKPKVSLWFCPSQNGEKKKRGSIAPKVTLQMGPPLRSSFLLPTLLAPHSPLFSPYVKSKKVGIALLLPTSQSFLPFLSLCDKVGEAKGLDGQLLNGQGWPSSPLPSKGWSKRRNSGGDHRATSHQGGEGGLRVKPSVPLLFRVRRELQCGTLVWGFHIKERREGGLKKLGKNLSSLPKGKERTTTEEANQERKKYYTSYSKLSEVKLLTIGIASPLRILQWAEKTLPNGKIYGEVLNANTLHHKTFKPQKGGLFCERIFGPLKDFECACGKIDKSSKQSQTFFIQETTKKKNQYTEVESRLNNPLSKAESVFKEKQLTNVNRKFCPDCDVEYTWSVIRRYQLGYIKLCSPVTHIWFLKGTPSYLSLLLDMKKRYLQFITYCSEILTIEKSSLPIYSVSNVLKSNPQSLLALPESPFPLSGPLLGEMGTPLDSLDNSKRTPSILFPPSPHIVGRKEWEVGSSSQSGKELRYKVGKVSSEDIKPPFYVSGSIKATFSLRKEQKAPISKKGWYSNKLKYSNGNSSEKSASLSSSLWQTNEIPKGFFVGAQAKAKEAKFLKEGISMISIVSLSVFLKNFSNDLLQINQNSEQLPPLRFFNFQRKLKHYSPLIIKNVHRAPFMAGTSRTSFSFKQNVASFPPQKRWPHAQNSFGGLLFKKGPSITGSSYRASSTLPFALTREELKERHQLPNLKNLSKKMPIDLYILCLLEQMLHKSSLTLSIQNTWEYLYKQAFIKAIKKAKFLWASPTKSPFLSAGETLSPFPQSVTFYSFSALSSFADHFPLSQLPTSHFFSKTKEWGEGVEEQKKGVWNIKTGQSWLRKGKIPFIKMSKGFPICREKGKVIYTIEQNDKETKTTNLVLKNLKNKYINHVFKLLENIKYPILSLNYTTKFLQKNRFNWVLGQPSQIEKLISSEIEYYLLKNTTYMHIFLTKFFLNSFILDFYLRKLTSPFKGLQKRFTIKEFSNFQLLKKLSIKEQREDISQNEEQQRASYKKGDKESKTFLFYKGKRDSKSLIKTTQSVLMEYKNFKKIKWAFLSPFSTYKNKNKKGEENSFATSHIDKSEQTSTYLNGKAGQLVTSYLGEEQVTLPFLKKKWSGLSLQPLVPKSFEKRVKKEGNELRPFEKKPLDLKEQGKARQGSIRQLSNKKNLYNNVYTLSHRERWDIEKDWQIFTLFTFGTTEYLDSPIYTYKNRLFSFLNLEDYTGIGQTPSDILSRAGGSSPFVKKVKRLGLAIETSTIKKLPKEKASLALSSSFYSGAGIVQQLLNEFDFYEIKKLDTQNRLILYQLNKYILKLKKQVQIFVYDKTAQIELKELCKKRDLLIRRTKLVRKLFRKNSNPASMILTFIPVLPPDLRPIVKMGSQIAASDLNRLYQRVIYRNDRLKKFLKDPATSQSYEMKYAQRLLQEAVDNLLQNGKSGPNSEKDARGRALKSLSDVLKGKQGRFRQFLLGKRVDYSGRSVIVVGPKLNLHECGLPLEMAKELYLPFLLKSILNKNYAKTVVGAKTLIKNNSSLAHELLREIMQVSPVLLNRAPTLHRLGIQAFVPKLIEGRAILLHPLVCSAFNADFDGDQMAVHIPITVEARAEAWKIMLSRNNILSTATGEPLAIPSQDMVLGCYYLTTFSNHGKILRGSGMYFNSLYDVIKVYEQRLIDVHSLVWVPWTNNIENGTDQEDPLEIRLSSFGQWQEITSNYHRIFDSKNNLISQYICTTPGRILFNLIIQKTIID